MAEVTAGEFADEGVALLGGDPQARLVFLQELYKVPAAVDRGYLPFRRAASAFMGWQLRRGLLNPESCPSPGSPWWRAVNDALLRDTCEASAIAFGRAGDPRTAGVTATLEFIREPTAQSWYRAHNMTIASAYLANEDLARREGRVERFFINLVLIRVQYAHALVAQPRLALREGRVERFFINLVLIRVQYAHALVAQPRLALGWLAPIGRLIGDPRLGMTGIFLSLSRVLPARYPLDDDVSRYVEDEHSLGHLLDVGVIVPRLAQLYSWSASELGLPALNMLLDHQGPTPTYAWDPRDAEVWHPEPSLLARAARRAVPTSSSTLRAR